MTKKDYWMGLPILLLAYQIFVLAHYGFGSNDYGYLFGMGWRILNGQDIYTDFLYARPPLSPYLTAFWLYVLPNDGQFYYARVVNYLYGFTSSTLLLLILKRHFVEYFKKAKIGLILAVIVVFNVNYIAHFWHTTDGLLMASIALFIILTKEKPSVSRIILGSIFVLLSMMCKQSFYPLPFTLAATLLVVYNYKIFLKFAVVQMIITLSLFLLFYFYFNEQLTAYLDFKHYESQVGPFLEAAIFFYIFGWAKMFPISALLIFLFNGKYLFKYIKRKQYAKTYARFIFLFSRYFIMLYGLLLLQFTQTKLLEGVTLIIFHIPLLGGLVVAVLWFLIELQQKRLSRKQINTFMILTMTISVAWMSSLSWGYKTPALYSGSIIFFYIYLNWHYSRKHIPSIYLFSLFSAYIIAVSILQLYSVNTESTHLGKYSNKLNGVYERNIHELKTFKYIDKRVSWCVSKDKSYAVVPSNPYIDWIHENQPTLSLDWVSNVEMLNQRDRLKKELSEVDCIITDPYYEFWNHPKFGFDPKEIANIDYNVTEEQKDFNVYCKE